MRLTQIVNGILLVFILYCLYTLAQTYNVHKVEDLTVITKVLDNFIPKTDYVELKKKYPNPADAMVIPHAETSKDGKTSGQKPLK